MSKYLVYVPIAGNICKEIEAESADEAIDLAFDEGFDYDEVCELDMYEKLVEGNVCYIYCTQAYAELEEE